jgi:hypothetical protein
MPDHKGDLHPDLFDSDRPKRDRLRELGCREAQGFHRGSPYWVLPDGRQVGELGPDGAFAWLQKQEGGAHG